MEALLIKSGQNFKSAILLDKRGFYSSVPHCAYYSCFQLLMYIEGTERDYNKGENSHERLINAIESEIKRNHRLNLSEYNRKISNLKMTRKNADYKKIIIDNRASLDCINAAFQLNRLLVKLFDIEIDPKYYNYDEY